MSTADTTTEMSVASTRREANRLVWGVLLGEPSAGLRAKLAGGEVRVFTPYQSL
jgi:hypothetical protein